MPLTPNIYGTWDYVILQRIGSQSWKGWESWAILNLESAYNPTCEACLQGKMTRSPFVGQMARAKDMLEIIHSDVCGPFR